MIDSGLIQKVLKKLNLDGRIEQVTPLVGGISAGMTLVELFLPSGKEKWIIRQPSKETLSKRSEVARMEYELLKLLSGKSLPVPSPVYLDETSEIFNTPTLVLEYLPGLVSFSVPAYPERVDQMARMLAAIHNTETSQLTTTKVPTLETSLQGLFVDEPKTMFEDLDEELILSTLNDHLPLLKNEPSVLLHGDYWTGNLL